MIWLDTNVVIRFLVNDDKTQATKAQALIAKNEVYLSLTVLLECEWVLRGAYDFSQAEIAGFFRALLGLENLHIAAPAVVDEALRLYANGLDFANALHLVQMPAAGRFASFDRNLIKRAGRQQARALFTP
ncbi:MAG: type II toxin-antitoxin system VapC family toxin [Stagnimonas sp.]|nr:type II toxin-antitoxin system VapC family toxin [Stagnimonas sp.]